MSKPLFAVIASDSPRAEFWRACFRGRVVPILPGGPIEVEFTGEGIISQAHYLDMDRLDEESMRLLLAHLAENWECSVKRAKADLLLLGLPIVCGDDLTITTKPEAVLAWLAETETARDG